MQLGRIAEEIGLKWGGKFYSIKDLPHFEYHPKLTVTEALERHKAKQPLFDDEPKAFNRKPPFEKKRQRMAQLGLALEVIVSAIKKALKIA